jgi:hypothetical protein
MLGPQGHEAAALLAWPVSRRDVTWVGIIGPQLLKHVQTQVMQCSQNIELRLLQRAHFELFRQLPLCPQLVDTPMKQSNVSTLIFPSLAVGRDPRWAPTAEKGAEGRRSDSPPCYQAAASLLNTAWPRVVSKLTYY